MPSSSQRELFNSATSKYAAALQSNADALEYLKKRGLSADSVRSFSLGVVAEPLTGHEQYQGRLSIPYLTRSGAVGMSFRCIVHEDCKPIHNDKYQWPSGLVRRIFNTPALDVPSPFIVICEGEMDTMTAAQAGLPAVGVPGVENWQPFFARVFKGYDDVFILADGDPLKKRPNCRKCKDRDFPECQGHRAGLELANKISSDVPQARTVMMPEGYDVNSYVLENSPDALRARIGV